MSLATVQENFRRYDLLDGQVEFLVGWFKDTLPQAPVDKLAILRFDGAMYQSTMAALTALYEKVSVGSFIIVDDYGTFESCRSAVSDFRRGQEITDTIYDIDGTGVYWQTLRGL